MNELQKELDGALLILSAIPVSGDAVDFMAAAKQKIRRAVVLSKPGPEKEEKRDG